MPSDDTPRPLLKGIGRMLAVVGFGLGHVSAAVFSEYGTDTGFMVAVGLAVAVVGFVQILRLRGEVARYA